MIVGRHNNCSLIFVSQTMFVQNEAMKSIRRNSNYLVCFKSPGNILDVSHLSAQMGDGVKQAYKLATLKPFSYLFITITQEVHPNLRFMSNLFDNNHYVPVYINK